ncbi:MAG: bifunctional 4-hydroxy-2-oxoglutarate aldolase/2-dehydro-3-deoxy-phosphogluconate aldolase [Clostridia bacterium]|nr:bifunctional 4-hydroxy-2-oxoglutarate aldolase/2-dehydro-3-deoxy-phosphogluconate aldolase [Clostridia bacterium]
MNYTEFIEQMYATGIVPVIKLENTDNAVKLAKALMDGGIACAEVTFRAAGADKVIKAMTEAYPDMLVGAGTVLDTDQVDKSIKAGAKFCVAPGLNPKVVKHCLDQGVPFVPGVANGSQIEQAMDFGLNFVKFFPAEQSGGLNYIKAVSAPYGNMLFMPTGGVNENNLNNYLAHPKVVCCGGSWIVPDNLVREEKWEEITALCKKAVNKMLGFELAHVGINCNSEDEAVGGANVLKEMFGFERKEGNSSVFADSFVELMKTPYKGANGHIAIATNSVKRAVAVMKKRGFEVDESTLKTDAKGNMVAVYFKQTVGGFALHLVQKK